MHYDYNHPTFIKVLVFSAMCAAECCEAVSSDTALQAHRAGVDRHSSGSGQEEGKPRSGVVGRQRSGEGRQTSGVVGR